MKLFTPLQVMIDFKKMDDKGVVFVNKPLSEKKEKEFNDFLKSRKNKTRKIGTTKKLKFFI
ncbi:hypothetical protein BH10BAC2_BH10BAC2_01560 [soil metagenome]